ncbi:hypothetical protein PIB30_099412, partial [Stylosanthes scabra]|nr:hypothetical protein [Stylosanthes scabra]
MSIPSITTHTHVFVELHQAPSSSSNPCLSLCITYGTYLKARIEAERVKRVLRSRKRCVNRSSGVKVMTT